MKKILSVIILSPIIILIIIGYMRIRSNKTQIIPYPYVFTEFSTPQEDAPVLIAGDQQGERLYSLKKEIEDIASQNLSKKIRVGSIAKRGYSLARTLHTIKNLKTLPQVLIYYGNGQEHYEKKFHEDDYDSIKKNFNLYEDSLYQTLLILYPPLSKVLYFPLKYEYMEEKLKKDNLPNYEDLEVLKRNEISFLLYRNELKELINFSQENSIYLIFVTSPINPDILPEKVCSPELDPKLKQQLSEVKTFFNNNDYKSAYRLTHNLSLLAESNPEVQYLNAISAMNAGQKEEALKSLTLSQAYDCSLARGNSIYNSILMGEGNMNKILVYDFQKLLLDNWQSNVIFADEVYPQNYYLEKLANDLAHKIKNILRL